MRKLLFLFSLLAGLAGVSYADTLNFTVSGAPYKATGYGGNYYISPYYAYDATTRQNLVLFCLDFNHGINNPDSYEAVLHRLPVDAPVPASFQYGAVNSSALAYNPKGGASVYIRYLAAVELFSQELAALNALADVNSDYGYRVRAKYQYAAWGLFVYPGELTALTTSMNSVDKTYSGDFVHEVNVVRDDAIAKAKGGGVNASDWIVVTPATVGAKQEFLAHVPEPSAIVLLATVAGLVGLVVRRRRCR